jgi:hypothetical protein
MCLCWFWMVFAPTNFIEADWKAERLSVRSSFWWPEAARSRNKHGRWWLRLLRERGHDPFRLHPPRYARPGSDLNYSIWHLIWSARSTCLQSARVDAHATARASHPARCSPTMTQREKKRCWWNRPAWFCCTRRRAHACLLSVPKAQGTTIVQTQVSGELCG